MPIVRTRGGDHVDIDLAGAANHRVDDGTARELNPFRSVTCTEDQLSCPLRCRKVDERIRDRRACNFVVCPAETVKQFSLVVEQLGDLVSRSVRLRDNVDVAAVILLSPSSQCVGELV